MAADKGCVLARACTAASAGGRRHIRLFSKRSTRISVRSSSTARLSLSPSAVARGQAGVQSDRMRDAHWVTSPEVAGASRRAPRSCSGKRSTSYPLHPDKGTSVPDARVARVVGVPRQPLPRAIALGLQCEGCMYRWSTAEGQELEMKWQPSGTRDFTRTSAWCPRLSPGKS